VIIEVSLAEDNVERWRYRLTFKQDKQRRPLIEEESVWKEDEHILSRPDDDDRRDRERLRQTHLEQVITNQRFRPVAEFLPPP